MDFGLWGRCSTKNAFSLIQLSLENKINIQAYFLYFKMSVYAYRKSDNNISITHHCSPKSIYDKWSGHIEWGLTASASNGLN